MKTLVVGGGIGGLTAAIALARTGHQVTLAEKMEQFSPVGAGIIMAPNAAKILAELGVDLSRHGHALPSLDLVGAGGQLLQRLETQRLAGQYGPMLALSRPDLHAALLEQLPERVQLILGSSANGIRQDSRGVSVWFGDEPDPHTFDVVVGADGLHSTVRRLTLGQQPLLYSGATSWRGLTCNPGFLRAVEAWGPGTRIGVVPLRDGQLYYYLVRSAPRRAPELDWPDGFRAAFAAHHSDLTRLFDMLTDRPPLHHDLEELAAPVWGSDRVFLLGDAAHAMTPNQGQGAAMAIEDAYGLMKALQPGIAGALQRYTTLRHERVRAIQLTSRRIGKFSHWTNPLARTVRNTLMRALPPSLVEAQYHKLVQPALDLMATA
ncbi:MAG: FAD-dependent monooxygenase [Micromonospora sp.]